MNSDKEKKLKGYSVLSLLVTVLGAVILTYMIIVEDEPGALPLLLIVAGIAGYVITRIRLRSRQV